MATQLRVNPQRSAMIGRTIRTPANVFQTRGVPMAPSASSSLPAIRTVPAQQRRQQQQLISITPQAMQAFSGGGMSGVYDSAGGGEGGGSPVGSGGVGPGGTSGTGSTGIGAQGLSAVGQGAAQGALGGLAFGGLPGAAVGALLGGVVSGVNAALVHVNVNTMTYFSCHSSASLLESTSRKGVDCAKKKPICHFP